MRVIAGLGYERLRINPREILGALPWEKVYVLKRRWLSKSNQPSYSAAAGAPMKRRDWNHPVRCLNGKRCAIDYARNCRFGSTSGSEIHLYDDAGEKVVEVIPVKGSLAFGA